MSRLPAMISLAAIALTSCSVVDAPRYCGPIAPQDAAASKAMEARLAFHLSEAFSTERHIGTEGAAKRLQHSADHIHRALKDKPFKEVNRMPIAVADSFTWARRPVHNIEALVEGATPDPAIVIGAHYDSASGTPGVNDNGSGAAALLELALHFSERKEKPKRSLRFVFFANEEEPFFGKEAMGSSQYVAGLGTDPRAKVHAMISIETILYYTRLKESQCLYPRFNSGRDDPSPIHEGGQGHAFLPRVQCALSGSWLGDGLDVGDFVAFVSSRKGKSLVDNAARHFCEGLPDMKVASIALPGILGTHNPVHWSDHAPFLEAGIPSLMVTDTAPLRYPYYHSPDDSLDILGTRFMGPYARVVFGLRNVIERLANE